MERPVKPQNLYISQKRAFTIAMLLFALSMCAMSITLLVFISKDGFMPDVYDRVEQIISIVCASIWLAFFPVHIALQIPILFRKYMIIVDERGIDIRCTVFRNALIPWSNIVSVNQWGGKNGVGGAAAAMDKGVSLAVEVRDLQDYRKSLKSFVSKIMTKEHKSDVLLFSLEHCKGKPINICAAIKESASYYLWNDGQNEVRNG